MTTQHQTEIGWEMEREKTESLCFWSTIAPISMHLSRGEPTMDAIKHESEHEGKCERENVMRNGCKNDIVTS